MNYLSSFKRLSQAKQLAVLLIAATLAWAIGLPMFFTTASAFNVTSFSATASSSAPTTATNYGIQWTTATNTAASALFRITFSPGTSDFSLASLVNGDIAASSTGGTATMVANVGGCTAAAGEFYPSTISNAALNKYVEFTMCAGANDTIASGVTMKIYFTNNHVVNPTTAPASYVIRLSDNQSGGNFGDTRMAVISQVTVTAAVDTSLTFTINGVNPGVSVNGTTTTATSTATTIAFGTSTPNTVVIAAQDLRVTTNAKNGFQVTVIQSANLTSSNGADIDVFVANNGTGTPSSWQAPANALNDENTWGHYGLMSDDADLTGGAFGSNLWVGNFATTTRVVFSHATSSDGVTQNIGKTKVAFALEVGPLQEAATDYTNTLTYVCTPTF